MLCRTERFPKEKTHPQGLQKGNSRKEDADFIHLSLLLSSSLIWESFSCKFYVEDPLNQIGQRYNYNYASGLILQNRSQIPSITIYLKTLQEHKSANISIPIFIPSLSSVARHGMSNDPQSISPIRGNSLHMVYEIFIYLNVRHILISETFP